MTTHTLEKEQSDSFVENRLKGRDVEKAGRQLRRQSQ